MRWEKTARRRPKPIQPHAAETQKPVKIERPPPEPPRCWTCQKRVVWLRVDGGIAAFDPPTMARAITRRRLRHLGLPLEMVGARLHAKSCRRRPTEPIEAIDLTDAWGLPWWPIPRKGKPMHLDSIRDRLILVLDTETTGLDVENDRVVELGAVYFWRGEMVGRPLNIRINPEMPIPPKATETHKITDADVANAPTFAQVAPRLVAHLSGEWADKHLRATGIVTDGRDHDPPLLAGYNILSYDAPLLDAELERAGEFIPGLVEIIDPIVFARWHHPDKPGRLVDLCEAFGIPLTNAHAAWADAEATGRLLYRLLAEPENNRAPAPGFIPPTIADPVGTSSFYDPPGLDSPCAIGRQSAILERLAAERAEFGHYFYRDRERPNEIIRCGYNAKSRGRSHKGANVRDVPVDCWTYMLKHRDLHPGAARLMIQLGGKPAHAPGAYGEAPAPEPQPEPAAAQAAAAPETTATLEDAPW